MNAICLVIDRLHAGYVGAYGNSWISTPAIDRLAWEGFLFDQVLIDGPRLETLYRSLWQGRHALLPSIAGDEARPSLADLLAARGVSTALITDEPEVAEHPLAKRFGTIEELPLPERAAVAETLDATHLAGVFAQVIEWLESAPKPFLLWCHLKGLGAPWDGPLEFRRSYVEEEDPEPPQSAEVPNRLLPTGYNPDELLGISQTYAGQVTLLDTCLGALMEFLASDPLGLDTLLVLLSARGFPLGEHHRVGPCDEALYNELVHVPLIVRMPDSFGAGGRSPALVEPADLWATLLDALGAPSPPVSPTARSLIPVIRGEADALRDRLCIAGTGLERAIATPAWYLRMAASRELYVRPDDRWQVNDVADRCPEIVDSLRDVFAQYHQILQSGHTLQLRPLDESLLTIPE